LFCAGILIAQSAKHLERYLTVTLVIAALSALLLLLQLARGEARALFDSRFTISSEENPIQLGRQSAEGLIIATYVLLAERRASLRGIATAIVPVLAIALLAAGSRGPVLGALIGL